MTCQLLSVMIFYEKNEDKGRNDFGRQSFYKYLSSLYREERKYLNRMLKSRGMGSAAVRFMMYIYHNQGSNQKKVCTEMGIDEGLGTRVMKKLESEQMIVRSVDPQDARSHILEVTDKGESFVVECKQMQAAFWENVTQSMQRKERGITLYSGKIIGSGDCV